MVLRVACQLVPLRNHALERLGVICRAVAGNEERRLDIARGKLIEKLRSIRARSVVKGDGNQLFGEAGGGGRHAQGQYQQQRQCGAEGISSFHGFISLPTS